MYTRGWKLSLLVQGEGTRYSNPSKLDLLEVVGKLTKWQADEMFWRQ